MPEAHHLTSIIRYFFPESSLVEAKAFGAGNINDTFRVVLDWPGGTQVLLLQRLNHHVFRQPEAVMDNMGKIARWLAHRPEYPLRVAAPLPAPDGRLLYCTEDGNYWRVFPFFDQTYTPEGLAAPAVAREAARAYGAFANALRDFPATELTETIPGFHDTDQRWQLFLQTLEADVAGRVQETQREIAAMFDALPLFEQISRLKQSGALPLRVTHNDTKAGNILFDTNTHQAVAVIDWDTVMPGTILSDFGDMVRTFTPNVYEDAPEETLALRRNILDALEEGFLEQTGHFLAPAEKEYLRLGGQWITGEQALRFLTDYLAGDTYYKVKYADHNLVRARNQLALLKALSV